MVIDGLIGTEGFLVFWVCIYMLYLLQEMYLHLLIAVLILIFIGRRIFLHISRFEGVEMKRSSHIDANIALTMILLLMISLSGMNAAYVALMSQVQESIFMAFIQ